MSERRVVPEGSADAPLTGSPQLMRRMNRSRVLQALRDGGSMSRPAISGATGLSKITVDAVATELLAGGRVVEVPEPPTGNPGRRARILSFRPESAHVAVIDIGATRARVAIADLAGVFVSHEQVDLMGVESGAAIIGLVRASLRRVIAAADKSTHDIRALCIATPGIVDPITQRVTYAPQLPDWDHLDLVAEFSFIGDAPIDVVNEVHLAVVGEQWRGAARGCDDVAYVHLGVGVGLGVVKSGNLIRGAHGGAGEIGYLPVLGLEIKEHSRGRGSFEWLVGGPAYERAAQDQLNIGGAKGLHAAANRESGKIDAEFIYKMAKGGDPEAIEIVDRILSHTAAGIASVVAVLDPELVIVGGGISEAGSWLLERLGEKLSDLTLLTPSLVLAGLGGSAALIGATKHAIDACEHELIELGF